MTEEQEKLFKAYPIISLALEKDITNIKLVVSGQLKTIFVLKG